MPILNYTTQISFDKTIGEIQKVLGRGPDGDRGGEIG